MLQFTDVWLTADTVWKASIIVFLLLNLKMFPFIYHLRILNGVRFLLQSQRPPNAVQPEHLFQPLITSSKACLMEIDVFGHKSNSSYFADIDVARVHLITTLFGKGIEKIRGSTTMNGLSRRPRSKFTLALGAVSCTFKKELLPYETYDMWTRILSWDEKWVYIVTHFVKRSSKINPRISLLYPDQNTQESWKDGRDTVDAAKDTSTCRGPVRYPVAASALSKVVFKNGRLTIKPREIMEASGLLQNPETPYNGPRGKLNARVEKEVEETRQRGLRLAALLAGQTELEDEFNGEVALGRHYDGLGAEGVVATLAQLGGISKFQLV